MGVRGRGSRIFNNQQCCLATTTHKAPHFRSESPGVPVPLSLRDHIHQSNHSHVFQFGQHSPIHKWGPTAVSADIMSSYRNIFPLYLPVEMLQIYVRMWIGNTKTRKYRWLIKLSPPPHTPLFVYHCHPQTMLIPQGKRLYLSCPLYLQFLEHFKTVLLLASKKLEFPARCIDARYQ